MATTTQHATTDTASLLAVEVLIWQLLRNGVLPAEPLANELERYAGFMNGGGDRLRTLARMARHGGWTAEQQKFRREVDEDKPN